ncbi:hypothetical protein PVAND_004931 [Polypedilum vanderplanki]|uniref:Uncharacterized protein n=1 Tax=Polypedilum vanderplanki TaxID=319348 RepID=A0A9J6C0I5_POLVA|nr:hypothetical protein PVAND_004931 [Polypedilum vanderplanki]
MDFGKKVKAETSQKIKNTLSSTTLPSQNSFIVLGNAYINDNKDSKSNEELLDELVQMVDGLTHNVYSMQQDLYKVLDKSKKLEQKVPKPILIKENSTAAVPKMIQHIEKNWSNSKYPEPYFVDCID